MSMLVTVITFPSKIMVLPLRPRVVRVGEVVGVRELYSTLDGRRLASRPRSKFGGPSRRERRDTGPALLSNKRSLSGGSGFSVAQRSPGRVGTATLRLKTVKEENRFPVN